MLEYNSQFCEDEITIWLVLPWTRINVTRIYWWSIISWRPISWLIRIISYAIIKILFEYKDMLCLYSVNLWNKNITLRTKRRIYWFVSNCCMTFSNCIQNEVYFIWLTMCSNDLQSYLNVLVGTCIRAIINIKIIVFAYNYHKLFDENYTEGFIYFSQVCTF